VFVLKFNEGAAPTKENQLSRTYGSNFYAGRPLPVHDVTEHYTSAWNFAYSLFQKSDYDKLRQLFLDGDTVIFRERNGFKVIGTLSNLKANPKRTGITVTFTIEENDSSEVIDYD
jgi:hypothetical protein